MRESARTALCGAPSNGPPYCHQLRSWRAMIRDLLEAVNSRCMPPVGRQDYVTTAARAPCYAKRPRDALPGANPNVMSAEAS